MIIPLCLRLGQSYQFLARYTDFIIVLQYKKGIHAMTDLKINKQQHMDIIVMYGSSKAQSAAIPLIRQI